MSDESQKNRADSPVNPSHSVRKQDPLVQRLKPQPDSPMIRSRTMVGFIGNSDRPGYSRLYFTRELNYYAEFRTEDILQTATIPPEEAPLRGEQATRVVLPGTAEIAYTRVRSGQPGDEFDIDFRLRARSPRRTGVFARANFAETDFDATCGCGTQPIDTCPTMVTACPTLCETDCCSSDKIAIFCSANNGPRTHRPLARYRPGLFVGPAPTYSQPGVGHANTKLALTPK